MFRKVGQRSPSLPHYDLVNTTSDPVADVNILSYPSEHEEITENHQG